MYWTAKPARPAAPIITHVHVDGEFLSDALHHCAKGYNEVVVFSRMNPDTFNNICRDLGSDGKAHKIEKDALIRWPTVDVLRTIEEKFG